MIAFALPSPSEIPTLVWSGLVTGSVSAALAVGLVLVFRVSRVVNLAIGSFYVLGAFVFEHFGSEGVGVGLAALVVVLAGFGAGVAEDKLVLRPLRRQAPFTQLLATVGVAIVIEGMVIVLKGRQPVRGSPLLTGDVRVGDVRITWAHALLFLFAAIVAFGAQLQLRHGATGKVVAAMTDDSEAATMVGIDVARIRFLTYGLVGVVGAVVGMLTVPFILVDFSSGLPLSLAAFIAAVLGGGLSPLGAWLGGLALGLVDSFGARVFSHSYAEILTATFLIAVVLLTARFPAFRALDQT